MAAYLSAAVIFTVFVISAAGGRRERERLRSYRHKKVPLWMLAAGGVLYRWVRRIGGERNRRLQLEEALLLDPEECYYRAAVRFSYIWLLMGFSAFVLLGIGLQNGRQPVISALSRPDFGESEKVSLTVSGVKGVTEVTLDVRGKEPEDDELETVFQEAYAEILSELRNKEETSPRQTFTDEDIYEGKRIPVFGALKLPRKTGKGVKVVYRSLTPEVISDFGNPVPELPEEGLPAELLLTFRYKEAEAQYVLPLWVAPPAGRIKTPAEVFREELEEKAAGEDTSSDIVLPSEFEGQTVVFKERTVSPYPVVLLFLTAAGLIYFSSEEKLKEAYEKRNRELENGYPELLSKLVTLLEAGLSTRNAWNRIMAGYAKRNSRQTVFAEMALAENRMNSGMSEEEAYVFFGKHCGSPRYIRLGNLLSQNLRQGISGLTKVLKEEFSNSLTERKNAALRAGEEASARMLFPMVLMLGIVIVSLVIPAFMTL